MGDLKEFKYIFFNFLIIRKLHKLKLATELVKPLFWKYWGHQFLSKNE